MATPSERLDGQNINGWVVQRRLGTYPGMTGGHFSTGYIVQRGDISAFLKAMDLHNALLEDLAMVQQVSAQFEYEKDVLLLCGDRRLSRIVRLLDHGKFVLPDTPAAMSLAHQVFYMVFELAEGDIRRQLTVGGGKAASWKYRVLHHAAIGLTQLHGAGIAHQDLKPSNVLAFERESTFKLSDLGRVSTKTMFAPTDAVAFPGDLSYAPPEYHYGYTPADYQDKRLGSDAYLLGSLISFLFGHIGALVHTIMHVPDEYRPRSWQGSFNDILPYLISAHSQATHNLAESFPVAHRDELRDMYFYLCHPDPAVRGHPGARRLAGRPLGLDRYVSRFDLLGRQALLNERIAGA
ncbi:protein kinase domain-containing protein [Achromobacter mucicolens]|uniref:protein kinase domain-containing protein n=1 Tax=Achromobacter mucicolens TaxID=1389922 RepID=UPI0009BF25C9|nr:hypothetical protein [Achromobacter mucicolens]CAB3828650.1 hypothetical protein LMG26686_00840 [Achromobacter mucicolens]